MMKLQETFKYLYCKIPLVDPPPITRVLLFAEFIWVGENTQKVISFGDVCKYDWCLHKLFKTPLLRNVKKVEVSNYPQQIASVATNREKGSTWISGGIGRYIAVADCRLPLTSSTINRMVSGENLYLSYTSSSSRLSRVLLKSQNTQSRLIGIAFCLLPRRPLKMSAILLCWEYSKSTFL